mgnify:CR=1 FL=1
MKKDYFDTNIIKKPWGHEYVVFRNKKNLSVTYLRIKPNQQTSLHCHYKKKTGFIIVSGIAKIQLGLYEKSTQKFTSPSKLMIRTGLFHQIKNVGKNDLEAFEFESPCDKFDLIRFQDSYGRTKKNYETSKAKKPKKRYNFFSKKNLEYKFNNCSINIKYFKTFEEILENTKNSTIHTLMDGNIVNELGRNVVPYGDIVKSGTIRKLAEKFRIKNKVKIFTLNKT